MLVDMHRWDSSRSNVKDLIYKQISIMYVTMQEI